VVARAVEVLVKVIVVRFIELLQCVRGADSVVELKLEPAARSSRLR